MPTAERYEALTKLALPEIAAIDRHLIKNITSKCDEEAWKLHSNEVLSVALRVCTSKLTLGTASSVCKIRVLQSISLVFCNQGHIQLFCMLYVSLCSFLCALVLNAIVSNVCNCDYSNLPPIPMWPLSPIFLFQLGSNSCSTLLMAKETSSPSSQTSPSSLVRQ